MRIIIDRFEGDIAVVEPVDRLLNAPRAQFAGAHEGDTVKIQVSGKAHREGEAPHELFTQLRESCSLKQKQHTKASNQNPFVSEVFASSR